MVGEFRVLIRLLIVIDVNNSPPPPHKRNAKMWNEGSREGSTALPLMAGEFRVLIRGLIRVYVMENFENNSGSIPQEFLVAHRRATATGLEDFEIKVGEFWSVKPRVDPRK